MRAATTLLSSLIVAASACAGAAALAEVPAAVAPGHVPEPKGLHQGAMHGYTPNTVTGGTVVDTAGLSKLIATDHPLLLDVAEKDRKPPNMDKDMIWLPNHRSIPGAVFLEDGGRGTEGTYAEAFKTRVSSLTHGDKSKPIVTFCHPDCWGSWNAAKRLVDDGYTSVFWYPEGVEGWEAAHETRVVKPDTVWTASIFKAATE